MYVIIKKNQNTNNFIFDLLIKLSLNVDHICYISMYTILIFKLKMLVHLIAINNYDF